MPLQATEVWRSGCCTSRPSRRPLEMSATRRTAGQPFFRPWHGGGVASMLLTCVRGVLKWSERGGGVSPLSRGRFNLSFPNQNQLKRSRSGMRRVLIHQTLHRHLSDGTDSARNEQHCTPLSPCAGYCIVTSRAKHLSRGESKRGKRSCWSSGAGLGAYTRPKGCKEARLRSCPPRPPRPRERPCRNSDSILPRCWGGSLH